MKRLVLLSLLFASTLLFAQSWQSKDIVRVQDVEQSIKLVFSDSSYSYIQKSNISYIVNFPNSTYVQVGFLWDGGTSKIVSFKYNTITQPSSGSAKELSAILNSWL